jgi:hypothetical protein
VQRLDAPPSTPQRSPRAVTTTARTPPPIIGPRSYYPAIQIDLKKLRQSNLSPTSDGWQTRRTQNSVPARGVGSSPTFGTKTTSPPNPRKGRGAGRTAAQGAVPRMVPLEWRIHRSIPDDDGRLTSALRGLVSNRCASSPAVEGPRGGVG